MTPGLILLDSERPKLFTILVFLSTVGLIKKSHIKATRAIRAVLGKYFGNNFVSFYLQVKPMNCNIIPVNTDRHGMDPQSLGDVMSSWSPADAQDPNSRIPKIMYLIPNGGNPTGHTLTEERKRKIYEIAQKYNILILEDDPYFYLQFQKVCRD